MGKKGGSSKGGKKLNSVFKVAGAKSLKMKNKAKPVAAKMKQIVGQKIDARSQLDNKFNCLEDKIRQSHTASTFPVTDESRKATFRFIGADANAREEAARKTNDIKNLTASLQLA